MRPGSKIEKKILETRMREDRYHERTGRFIMCAIWTGVLPDGTRSPGYLESISGDRRPAVYVIPRSVLENAEYKGQVDPVSPGEDLDQAKRFASENVRMVHVEHKGLSSTEILTRYQVKVPFPFWTATSGELIPIPGQPSSYASVPSGDTSDDIARRKMIDRDRNMVERMSRAASRYGTPSRPVTGVPLSRRREKFPRSGDRWF